MCIEAWDKNETQTSSSEQEQDTFTQNFQSKIESKNYLDRIKALAHANHILKIPYVQHGKVLKKKDKKLIKGLYRRALNDYSFLDCQHHD